MNQLIQQCHLPLYCIGLCGAHHTLSGAIMHMHPILIQLPNGNGNTKFSLAWHTATPKKMSVQFTIFMRYWANFCWGSFKCSLCGMKNNHSYDAILPCMGVRDDTLGHWSGVMLCSLNRTRSCICRLDVFCHALEWGIPHAMWRNHAYASYLNSIVKWQW